MTPEEMLVFAKANPFRPFRIRTQGGQSFDIRLPKEIRVGREYLTLFTYLDPTREIAECFDFVGLSVVESVSVLEASVA